MNNFQVREEIDSARPLIQTEKGKHGIYALATKSGTAGKFMITLSTRRCDCLASK